MSTPDPIDTKARECAEKCVIEAEHAAVARAARGEPAGNAKTVATDIDPVIAAAIREATEQDSQQIARMSNRVHLGEHSEDCPFCLSKPSSSGVPNPMCHLCEMESERDALRAEATRLAAEVERLNNDHVAINAERAETRDIRKEMIRAQDEVASLRALLTVAEGALKWYAEQTRLVRIISSEGDKGRRALDTDGGKRADEALAKIAALKSSDSPKNS